MERQKNKNSQNNFGKQLEDFGVKNYQKAYYLMNSEDSVVW